MSTVISIYDTATQAEGFQVEVADSTLLGNRYFANSSADNFVGKEVAFDFDSSDLEKGAFLTTTYKNGNTVSWTANVVLPPRLANSDSVDPKSLDRLLFERIVRAQGADVNRAQAFKDLLAIKASRLAKRTDRAIEMLCALVLKEGKIEFDQPHSNAVGAENDHIQCKYYDPSKGANNHFVVAKAWSDSDATPYQDVCDMLNKGIARGRRYTDLLLGATAWANLSKDERFQKFAGATFHSAGMEINFGDIEGAQHVAQAVFNGIQLNVIVYSGAFKNSSGVMEQYLDSNAAILISEGIGRTLCGGCTLLADNVSYDPNVSFVDMLGKHCISIYKDFNNQTLEIREESRPLPAPRLSVNEMVWLYCDTSLAIASIDDRLGEVYKGVSFNCVNASGEAVTPTTAPACSATCVMSGEAVAITPAATSGKTYKYYATRDGVKDGDEIVLSGSNLTIPVDCDRDDNDKAMILCIEQ